MAKHDIVLLNTTSSGFETDLGSNVARIKGDADDLFSVRDASGVDKFAVSSVENSVIVSGDLTLTGNLSSSLSSTASFGRLDVTNLVGDASQMTDVDQIGHVSSSAQLASRISGAFQAGFVLEGENRVISGSSTSTGSFSKIFANVYSGDASDMFNVPTNVGTISGSAQIASDISGSFNKGIDLAANSNISGSATSTGSFGRLDVSGILNATDASQTTGITEALPSGILSGSISIASQISGAFTSGFEITQDSVHGTGNVISHSAAQTGSVTASLSSKGFFISGSVTSTGSFAHFNMGDYGGFGTTSQLSSSFARVVGATHGGKIKITDTSELTGWSSAGFISSSAQIAADISGSFNKGFGFGDSVGITVHHFRSTGYNDETAPTASINIISGSSTSTGSFGRVDNISSIVADASNTTGLPTPTGTVTASAQLAADISGSFNKGFAVGGDISGSATSTGSFGRLNFIDPISVTDVSGITGHETGHLTGASGIAADISGSFNKGFEFTGTISASRFDYSSGSLKIQSLDLGGTFTFGETKLTKKWDTSFVQTDGYGTSLGADISGSFNHGFSYQGTIAGSTTSTGSFNKIQSQELFVKEMVGVRKPLSGSMGHDTYISGSFKKDSHGKVSIPTFGRGHTVNTQQFSATGSMESQKYRARAGQLFVDNFGRLNMTVQTGSEVTVAGAWESGPQSILTNNGYAATAGTRDAFIMAGPYAASGSAVYDGIGWQRTSDVTTGNHSNRAANCAIGTVDAAFIMRYMSGAQPSNPTGRYGAFPGSPAHAVLQEFWDGVGWYRGPEGNAPTNTHVKRSGTAGKVGSVNSHIVFNGDDYPTSTGTADWNGVTWQSVGPHTPTVRNNGAGFGGAYDGVVAGGESPANTCVDEWNGTTWATATALPTAQVKAGGAGPQTAGLITGGSPNTEVQEYNGTSWSEGTALPGAMTNHGSGGTVAKAFAANTGATYLWTGGFVTGSSATHNNFQPSANGDGRYLLTKKLQANLSPGTAGGGSTSTEDGHSGGY